MEVKILLIIFRLFLYILAGFSVSGIKTEDGNWRRMVPLILVFFGTLIGCFVGSWR